VVVLGLAAHVAERLVQQDRHATRLRAARDVGDGDGLVGPHALAQHRRPAVDEHPAGGDPLVGFAARRQAAFGKHRAGNGRAVGSRHQMRRPNKVSSASR
jgi:hypothetical protein